MDLEKLEQDIRALVDNLDEESFIYDLLLAYDFPKATITRLRNGDRNQSKKPGEIIWKKNLCFTDRPDGDLFACIDALKNDPAVKKHHPRFIVVTDYATFLAIDTKTADSLDIPIDQLPKRANFFLPWAGMEKSAITSENPADIKAAEKMGQLYDLLLHNNEIENEESRHALNVFLSRLLFCFFAEDTGIFEDDQFTKLVDSHTVEDGSNVQPLLQRLFTALNSEDRSDYPDYIAAFPYVNGGLFSDELLLPAFSRKSRKMLIDCGALNWQAINPDIFGSMMQAVTLGEERSSIGMHYTSVVNIMKVIEPLFLTDLKGKLGKDDGNEKKLEKLLDRLYHIRIFDPACGSGNFLIIAYKELCRLEIEIFQQLQGLKSSKWRIARSGIRLNQFFGIEIDDFAAGTARLSLWLAEHQMNREFLEVFGETRPTLPLSDSGKIECANAAHVDWNEVCPRSDDCETYILGNPPFIGKKEQTKPQKQDIKRVFKGVKGIGVLDYVAIWYLKSAQYIRDTRYVVGLVSTNSISQGEQVGILWKELFRSYKVKIHFAHQAFRWSNEAKRNAAVHVVIIGFANFDVKFKAIYQYTDVSGTPLIRTVKNINPYLVEGEDTVLVKRRNSICNAPKISFGSIAIDKGHLILTDKQKKELIRNEPLSKKYIRPFGGGEEFINNIKRWCLWLEGVSDDDLRSMPTVKNRIDSVRKFRLSSNRSATNLLEKHPELFGENRQPTSNYLLIPKVSSESREYIPIGFVDKSFIANGSALTINDGKIYDFGILTSIMHMVWMKRTCGRMKSDYQYSNSIVYNNFPWPTSVSDEQRDRVIATAFDVLDQREKHSERTLAELYKKSDMPNELRVAHARLNEEVDKCYRAKSFKDDDDRLEYLFNLYRELNVEESASKNA